MRKAPPVCPILALLAVASVGLAQMIPNAPIKNFKLPLFNDEGYRSWYLKGAEGIYIDSDNVKILKMDLTQYTGDADDRPIGGLKSPEANFRIDQQTASGPGDILIAHDTIEITGEDWIWQSADNSITINENVKVKLFADIGDIIR